MESEGEDLISYLCCHSPLQDKFVSLAELTATALNPLLNQGHI